MASTGGLTRFLRDATFEFGTAFLPEGPDRLRLPDRRRRHGCHGRLREAGGRVQVRRLRLDSPENTAWWSQQTGYMPVRKSAVELPELKDFFDKNPQAKVAVEQLAKTKPQDAARVFVPNGDQIIGKGLEAITINKDEVQPAFDDVNQTLTDEAQPVLEQINELKSA